MQEDFR